MSRHKDSKTDDLAAPEAPAPKPGGSSFSLWAGGFLLLLLLGLWFAPSIVAMTELRHQILHAALPDYPGRMEVGSASLGWFSPAVLHDIQIFDLQGEPLVALGSVSTDSTLVSLASDRQHLGKITIEKPRLRIVARKDGSNLEDALAKLIPAKGSDSPSTPPELTLALSGGEVELVDAASKQSWKWREVKGDVIPPHGEEKSIHGNLSGAFGAADVPGSPLKVELAWQPAANGSLGQGTLNLQSTGLPLAPVHAFASRWIRDLQLAGNFSPDLKLAWSSPSGGTAFDISGTLGASDIVAAAPSLVGKDRFQVAEFQSQLAARWQGDRLAVKDLVVQSDIASVRCQGSAKIDATSSSKLVAALLASLRNEDCRLDGRIDLARLAALLPDTLRLRPGTQVTGGQLEVALSSSAAAGKRRLEGRLDASDLTALDSGRAIRWEQPLQFQFAAVDGQDGPVIETLTCKSEFLQAQASGTPQRGELGVQCDLDRLARELTKVVDLGASQMAGQVGGRIVWETKEGGRIGATAKLQIDGLNLALPGRRPWSERQLVVEASAAGVADVEGLHRLDAFEAILVSGTDRLEAKLLRPMSDFSATARWPLSIKLQGELATWQPRSEIAVAASGWSVAGQVKLDTQGEFSPDDAKVEAATLDLAQLILQGGAGRIDEPQLHLETSGMWNTVQRQFSSPLTTLVTTSLSLRAEKMQFALPADGKPQAIGDIAFRGDLARLSRWISITGQPPAWAAAGQIAGGARLTQKADTVSAAWNATIDNAALYRAPTGPAPGATAFRPAAQPQAWQEVWSEKQIVLDGQGTYQGDQDLAQLDQFSIGAAGVAIRAKGQTQKLRTAPNVALEGNLDYDLAQLAERFRGLIGPVKIAGRDSKPFKLEGPIFAESTPAAAGSATPVAAVNSPILAADLKGQFGLGWERIEVMGLKVGPGAFDARLAGSQIDVPPLDIAIEEGRLVAAPRIFLYSPLPTLAVGQGRVLDNVRLSPELCRAWMKYVTPILADVTQIDGRFSVDLVGGQVPLTDPNRLGAQGVIEIREITAGPGPAAQPLVNLTRSLKSLVDKKQLLGLGQTQPTWIHLPAQKIEFQVIDGRVYHKNLLMKIGDVTMKSSGSVGLDQTLDVVSEVPVLDQWIDKEKALSPLRGQMLKIPLRGSLGAPKFDLKVLKDLTGVVTGGLLEKFLGPAKP